MTTAPNTTPTTLAVHPLTAYAYPWDLVGNPGALDRLAAMGVTRVAVAAVYHGVRAATPGHPGRVLVDLPHSASLLPEPVDTGWGPPLPTRPDLPGFAEAVAIVRAHGLHPAAWVVLTHLDPPGGLAVEGAPTVVNALGDHYPYALCPADGAVRRYCAGVVAAVTRTLGTGDLVLESVGQLGVGHTGPHAKTGGAGWDRRTAELLSTCWCTACRARLAEDGRDPDRLQELARCAVLPTAAAPPAAVDELLDLRRVQRADAGRRTLVAALDAAYRQQPLGAVVVFATPDGAETGAAMPLPDDAPGSVSEWVLPGWDGIAELASRADRARQRLGAGARLGAYLNLLDRDTAGLDALGAEANTLAEHGIHALHLYHLGLCAPEHWNRAATALSHARRPDGVPPETPTAERSAT